MKSMIVPPWLNDGDLVSIVTPASWIEERPVLEAVKMLESSGFRVRQGDHVFSRSGPFAGTDSERLSDLQKAVDDPEVRAVLCSRGGYGMSRIIDRLDFTALRRHPKWFIGFSDITSLHMWLNNVCGVVSLHAEMPLNYSRPECSRMSYESMIQALRGSPDPVSWDPAREASFTVRGPVTGGNISLIYSMNGTPAQPDTGGAILFIEETGEQLYHLDRMLTSMRLTGMLTNLSALLVGGMEKITEGEHVFDRTVEEVIMDAAGSYGYPVLFNFPAGHISDNRPLYMGRTAIISQEGKTATLTWA